MSFQALLCHNPIHAQSFCWHSLIINPLQIGSWALLLCSALLIQPSISGLFLNVLFLNVVQIRSRARDALLNFTTAALEELRNGAGDGALRGADWSAVERFVEMEQTLDRCVQGEEMLGRCVQEVEEEMDSGRATDWSMVEHFVEMEEPLDRCVQEEIELDGKRDADWSVVDVRF